ncbi:GerW family sporulation protein [Laceyella putida]|uniref:GerW family sporulation protein n=1 Tax=Laceyella putida TaxID=110101 RepID=A0ABW2RMH8_9BACL
MSEHPIQNLMKTAMENIREMVDVNTIIGDPVETNEGTIIIPVSKVGFGFAAGGSEFKGTTEEDKKTHGTGDGDKRRDPNGRGKEQDGKFPFGGGSGGGISITPVGFIVIGETGIRLLNMDGNTHLIDRAMDMVPSLMEQLKNMAKKNKTNRNNGQCDPF